MARACESNTFGVLRATHLTVHVHHFSLPLYVETKLMCCCFGKNCLRGKYGFAFGPSSLEHDLWDDPRTFGMVLEHLWNGARKSVGMVQEHHLGDSARSSRFI